MEEKARKEGTGLKSRCYFGKLLFKDKQAQTSHLSSRNRSHFGNCRCLWEDFKAEGELQGAVSKVPTFCGCATSPWGLFQWHQTHRTWGTQQDTCTALQEPRVTCPGLPRSTPLTTLSLMGTRYFPACFGWESFVMLRDLVGLWEAVRMLRESRVCSSPASRLYGRAKQSW